MRSESLNPQDFDCFMAERHPGEDAAAYVQRDWIAIRILREYLEWLMQNDRVPKHLLRENRRFVCQLAVQEVVGQVAGGKCNSAQSSFVTVMDFLMECPEWYPDCQMDLKDLNEPMLCIGHDAMKAFTNWAVENRRVDGRKAADFVRWADQVVESL